MRRHNIRANVRNNPSPNDLCILPHRIGISFVNVITHYRMTIIQMSKKKLNAHCTC